jgi:quinol monooxygenase YgiN
MFAADAPATLINVLNVEPARQEELVESLRQNTETVIKTLHGWRSTDLVASADGKQVVIYSRWDSASDVEAMRSDPRMMAYFPKVAAMATLSSTMGATVLSHQR